MMIDLDDLPSIQKLDTQNTIASINDLPQMLSDAWDRGMSLALPEMYGLKNIVLAGVGSAGLSADLLYAYVSPHCPLPITVFHDYELPAWADGLETLVVVSSHSGNTEESLAVFDQAMVRGCRVLVMAGGGKLAERGDSQGYPVWRLDGADSPRTAVAVLFAWMLAVLFRLGLLPDPTGDLWSALNTMRSVQANLRPEVPIAHNPAKRLAGQLMGRCVAVFAADCLTPVARYWKCQFAETAKSWGQAEYIPDMNHNWLAGLNNPENTLTKTIALFLTSPSNHERNHLRLKLSRKVLMTQGINTDAIGARGEGPLAHIWSMLLFGDYTAYYLALAYGEDPAPAEMITMFEEALNSAD